MGDGETQASQQPLTSSGGTFAPFRYPAFRSIWIANLASNLGSTLQSVGAAWLMTELTQSHRLIAMVQVSATLPIMFFGIFAGAIADNFDRRRVMLVAQIGMLATSAFLAFITWEKWISPYSLLGLTMTIGIGTALNSPAWQASVRQQVGMKDLPQAISLNTISFNLARSVGPALGGLLITVWNIALAFAINAVSYIAMVVVLLRWRPETPPRERRPMLPAIGAGIRFCAASSPIRRVLLRGLAMGFGIAGYQAMVPAVVHDLMKGDELTFGLVLALFGIGSILAAMFATSARRRWGTEAVLAIAAAAFVVALLLLAQVHTLAAGLPAAFIAGIGWVMALNTINVAMQMRSPDAILGRCLSIYQAVTFGGMAMGSWFWGTLADWASLPIALHTAAAFLAISTILTAIFAPMPKPGEGRVDE